MAEIKDYVKVLEKARNRRKKPPYKNYAILAAVLIALIALVIVVGDALTGDKEEAAEAGGETVVAEETTAEVTLSEEELAEMALAAEIQSVVDSYSNLGLVQVSGYLNVRETPGSDGKIIGKLQQNGACEILDTEGEWYHISSGGLEGYINSQYVLTGEEARKAALEVVSQMAIVNAEKLNVRSEPVIDPTNVEGQALVGERYPLVAQVDDEWAQIRFENGMDGEEAEDAYISTRENNVTVAYALNEARKLDLRAMALSQYDNIVISRVSDYLNIREEPSMSGDTNIIGKFPSKAAGEILETLDGWYKIHSGSITGYISADPQYVAVGQEARDLALESATLMAVVNTDKLNVRTGPSTDASIWTQISKEERYNVLDQLDGWVEIELDAGDSEEGSDKAYISTRDNNVDVRYALNEAIKFSPLEIKAALRNRVVNYALQFVGGRYVWGGNDPHTGADCSGFVRYVLSNVAGVSMSRTSAMQAKEGKGITSSQMQPGDLIFYSNSRGTINHVAMYIGNGQIVHAASRKSGIKISTWNYRTPKAIRSFLD